jgi:hypothetical protein
MAGKKLFMRSVYKKSQKPRTALRLLAFDFSGY